MPRYDFRCAKCGTVSEVNRPMCDCSAVACRKCGAPMRRVYSVPNFTHGNTLVANTIGDRMQRDADITADLRVNHGIEKIVPVAAQSMDDVYRDVKASGGYVKERMAAEKEIADRKRRLKQREWMKKAMKRAPRRTQDMLNRKKAEASRDRAVRV